MNQTPDEAAGGAEAAGTAEAADVNGAAAAAGVAEVAEAASMEPFRALGRMLAGVERRYGVAPEQVQEKAALEASRAAEAAVAGEEEAAAGDAAAGSPAASETSPETGPETRWIQEKMETPGVQFFDYEYTLRLEVPFGRGPAALGRVRDYWSSRGMEVTPEAESPAGDVVANPGKGEWTLRAGMLDPHRVFVRVTSGSVLTSSSPLGNEKES